MPMSPNETAMLRRFWNETGGTLIEEFCAVSWQREQQGRRLIDGVIVLDGPYCRSDLDTASSRRLVRGQDLFVVQVKPRRLSLPLLGQAFFSAALMKRLSPGRVEAVALCRRGDSALESLADCYDVRVEVDCGPLPGS